MFFTSFSSLKYCVFLKFRQKEIPLFAVLLTYFAKNTILPVYPPYLILRKFTQRGPSVFSRTTYRDFDTPTVCFKTDTQDCYPRSMSFYHDRLCIGSASSYHPRTTPGHPCAVSHGRQQLLSQHVLPSCTQHKKDVLLSTQPLPSATACCNHACYCSPCHHGAVLHAPRSTVRPSASDIQDVCMVSLVFLASAIPPFYVTRAV